MKLSDQIAKALFWGVVLLGILDRIHLFSITIGYTVDDLTVVWMAANDYAHGVFHEPFFYGQDYGVMLEGLLAAPFVRLGADPIIAVPVVMAVLAMLPYWSFASYEYHRRNLSAAIFFAAIPILLPVEHGLQNTNLNGLAILALYPWIAGLVPSPKRSAMIGAVLAASAFVNLNALVAVAAFGTYFLLGTGKDRLQWLWATCGAVPVLLFSWWCMHFYATRDVQVVHTVFDWRMVFHSSLIPEALQQLDDHFAWLCPIWWPNGQVVLWLLAGIMVVFFRQGRKPAAWALAAAWTTIFISFGFAKIHDGTLSILFPYSRMFLVVPLILGWAFARSGTWETGRLFWIPAIALASMLTFTLRFEHAAPLWAETIKEQKGVPINIRRVDKVRADCRVLGQYAQETSAEVVVLERPSNPGQALVLNMGCPECEPSLPPTYMPNGDRRVWRIEEESGLQRKRILVVNGDPAIWAKAAERGFNVQAVGNGDMMLHLVLDAGLPVDSLMVRLGFVVGP
ncbi:MAG: hypothetical protein ACOH13_10735 [Flavobacteriales bacterium]